MTTKIPEAHLCQMQAPPMFQRQLLARYKREYAPRDECAPNTSHNIVWETWGATRESMSYCSYLIIYNASGLFTGSPGHPPGPASPPGATKKAHKEQKKISQEQKNNHIGTKEIRAAVSAKCKRHQCFRASCSPDASRNTLPGTSARQIQATILFGRRKGQHGRIYPIVPI